MKKTAVFIDKDFIAHDPGPGHVECPDRLEIIYKAIDDAQKKGKCSNILFPESPPASKETLLLNHTEKHISTIAGTAKRKHTILDPDTRANASSYSAAAKAAGAVVSAVDMVMENEVENAFALVRPPGHHAEKDRAMGFCLFNNIAIGAAYAVKKLQMERVLIVDWDLHHGNGTQNSFYGSQKVLYFSTHQYPYYPGSGGVDEVGDGKGKGFTVNVPLSGGQDDCAYASIFHDILEPVAQEFKPQLILVSAGFDIYQGDPLGTMGVTAMGFANLARIILDIGKNVCDGRVVFALEGGYSLKGLRDGVLAVLSEMVGTELESGMKLTPDEIEEKNRKGPEIPGVKMVQKIHSN